MYRGRHATSPSPTPEMLCSSDSASERSCWSSLSGSSWAGPPAGVAWASAACAALLPAPLEPRPACARDGIEHYP